MRLDVVVRQGAGKAQRAAREQAAAVNLIAPRLVNVRPMRLAFPLKCRLADSAGDLSRLCAAWPAPDGAPAH